MSDVFIAHVEEDADVALEIALDLEEAGYTTWCYEVDSIPGPSYLIQTGRAVEQAKAFIVLISPRSVDSRQVTKEVVRAHESGKEFIPILRDITHIEFQNRQPEWREAVGAAASIRIPLTGVATILPRIINGLKALGINPSLKTDTARIAQIGRALDELRRLPISEKAEDLPVPTRKPEPEPVTAEVPPARIAEEAGRQRRWIKPALIGAGSVVIIALIAVVLAKQFEGGGEQTGVPTTTPAVTQESTMLFFDDFESGELTSWRIVDKGGEARVGEKDGNHFLECENHVSCVAGDPSLTDYTVNVKVILLEGQALIRFRQYQYETDQGNVIDAYLVTLMQNKCNLMKIHSIADYPPQVTELVTTSVQIEPDTWYNLAITCQGNDSSVDINGVRKLSYVDEQAPILSGAIALGALENSGAFFDDIEVKKIQAEAVPPTPTSTVTPPPTTFVTFPDKNLEAAIRDALDMQAGDEIRATELANVGGLDAGRQNIVDLTGIEYCVKIDSLNLMGNRISDISALSSLTNLTELNLHRNQISDVSALSSLTNLTRLYLHENQISDITALSSLTNLTRLDLGGNKVSDISPLASLINLTELYLWENEVRDASPLSSLTKLTVLDINGNQINDISALSSLSSLNELYLDSNEIVDISSLASLNNLAKLSLSSNRVSDLGALSSSTNLEQLEVAGNRVSDVSPLSSLTNLSWLEFSGNQISDISALSSLTNLSFLNLEGNQISDILPLLANIGLAEGDRVTLRDNPLSATSLDVYIPQLEQRGVIVELD